MEGLNTRQRLSFSFPELWYSPLEFNSRKTCQHLTKIEQGGVSARKFEAALMHFSSDSFVAVTVVVVKSSLINYAPVNVNPRTLGREISRHLREIFRYLTSEIGDLDDFTHQEQWGSGPGYFPPRWTGWNRTVHVFFLKTHSMTQFFFLILIYIVKLILLTINPLLHIFLWNLNCSTPKRVEHQNSANSPKTLQNRSV